MTKILLLLLALQISTIVFDLQSLLLLLTLGGISYIYFMNNPLKHGTRFRVRSLLNWLPMGLLYAFLYMGRYNLTVSKIELGTLMSKEAFGDIFGAGTVTYAFSFLLNGPLVDRVGGKIGMLIGGIGAALANIAMGVVTYLLLNGRMSGDPTAIFAILYSINMYFQSYGAVSIVKVNAHWFHVKERGVFSGIFGTLISLGIFFAFSWSAAIVNATKVNPSGLGFFERIVRALFHDPSSTVNETWFVFFVPAILLIVTVIVEFFLLKDTPGEAGFDDFDTADASSGEMEGKISVFQVIRKVLTNPIILTIAVIEFCTGAIRNGLMHWYPIFAAEHGSDAGVFFKKNWGALLFLAGSYGGFFVGIISDRVFGSRRGPSATFNYAGMFLCVCVMSLTLWSSPWTLGWMAIVTSFLVIGIHGLLSGTATMDFGGRRGAATAVGVVDGFVYLGTGLQSLALGRITSYNWSYWPIFLIPFTILGTALAIRIWQALPNATRKSGGH
jgi:OPA family glycerol-3-phosphate transporter-like MFS transporter